jgi:hypothetical protein
MCPHGMERHSCRICVGWFHGIGAIAIVYFLPGLILGLLFHPWS